MPGASENIGGVSVSITGDISQLQAIQGPATATAQKIGQSVAAGFNTAAVSAGQLTAEIDHLSAAIQQEGAAASLPTQRNIAMAASFRQLRQSAGESVSEIQAVGGAVRVLSGEQGIRVVERFLTSLGAAGFAQAIYPLLGIAATADLGVRAFEHFAG